MLSMLVDWTSIAIALLLPSVFLYVKFRVIDVVDGILHSHRVRFSCCSPQLQHFLCLSVTGHLPSVTFVFFTTIRDIVPDNTLLRCSTSFLPV